MTPAARACRPSLVAPLVWAGLALLALLALGAAVLQRPLVAQSAGSPAAAGELLVGDGGLQLFPRFNKSFAPLANLAAGERLAVLRDGGPWKQVRVVSSGASGWVYCELQLPLAQSLGDELALPLAASPAMSSLVVKGWSPAGYAWRHGADPARVVALLARRIDPVAYAAFLAEDPPPGSAQASAQDAGVAGAAGAAGASGASGASGAAPPAAGAAAEEAPWESGPRAALEDLRAVTRGPSKSERQLEEHRAAKAARSAMAGGISQFVTDADEFALGAAVAARVLQGANETSDVPLSRYVSHVGLRLAEHARDARSGFWFAVLESDDVNAFSAPGGFVFITRGALERCENEAQLAALLAHEIAHLSLRHALRAMDASRMEFVRLHALAELDAMLPIETENSPLMAELTELGSELYEMTTRPFQRELEQEADLEALELLRAAGYAPTQMLALLAALRAEDSAASGSAASSSAATGSAAAALSSHPPASVRLQAVLEALEDSAPGGSFGVERFRRAVGGAGMGGR